MIIFFLFQPALALLHKQAFGVPSWTPVADQGECPRPRHMPLYGRSPSFFLGVNISLCRFYATQNCANGQTAKCANVQPVQKCANISHYTMYHVYTVEIMHIKYVYILLARTWANNLGLGIGGIVMHAFELCICVPRNGSPSFCTTFYIFSLANVYCNKKPLYLRIPGSKKQRSLFFNRFRVPPLLVPRPSPVAPRVSPLRPPQPGSGPVSDR